MVPDCAKVPTLLGYSFQRSALILFLHMNHSQPLARSPLPPRSALSVIPASQGPVYKTKKKAEENLKC